MAALLSLLATRRRPEGSGRALPCAACGAATARGCVRKAAALLPLLTAQRRPESGDMPPLLLAARRLPEGDGGTLSCAPCSMTAVGWRQRCSRSSWRGGGRKGAAARFPRFSLRGGWKTATAPSSALLVTRRSLQRARRQPENDGAAPAHHGAVTTRKWLRRATPRFSRRDDGTRRQPEGNGSAPAPRGVAADGR